MFLLKKSSLPPLFCLDSSLKPVFAGEHFLKSPLVHQAFAPIVRGRDVIIRVTPSGRMLMEDLEKSDLMR